MSCQWPSCSASATHSITVDDPDGNHEVWQVCSQHDGQVKKLVQRSVPLPRPPSADAPPTVEVNCSECGRVFEEPSNLPVGEREGCPDCRSTKRLVKVGLSATIGLHASLQARQFRPGRNGWLRRLLTGEFMSTFHRTWTTRDLDLDRENNTYRERLVHHGGTVLESRAKLSNHRGN